MSASVIHRDKPVSNEPCPCGSGLLYNECHRRLKRRISQQNMGEALFPWPTAVEESAKEGFFAALQTFDWAFRVHRATDGVRFSTRSQWPVLIECGVYAAGNTRFDDPILRLSNKLEARLATVTFNPPDVLDYFASHIESIEAIQLPLVELQDWPQFAAFCLDWAGRIVPGQMSSVWERMANWYLRHIPDGIIQAIRVDPRRHQLRLLIDQMAEGPYVSPNDVRITRDLGRAGRTPNLSGWGLAIPMTYDPNSIWGFAGIYQFMGFIFCLPTAHALENISRNAQALFSLTDHWARGDYYTAFTPSRLTLSSEQHRQFLVWYIEQMSIADTLFLNPLTFAKDGILNFERQRSTMTTWEMARAFVEQMLASTEPEARGQNALLVLDKLTLLLLGENHTGNLIAPETEEWAYEALNMLPTNLREPALRWAQGAWRNFDEEVWEATVQAAQRPNRHIRLGQSDLPLREAAKRFIRELRNLVHGYMRMDDRSQEVWRAMSERVPPSLSDVILTLYIAFLADPLRYKRAQR